ncbi:hypothetical protein [Oleispirillum naphthae]|uniref:hypothetical protein n=1 Tax=Oleispirillum naphthae TaxID=2838853 RepID=UPI00308239AA
METGGIKSSGLIRPQDLGSRPQVRRVSAQTGASVSSGDSQQAGNRRVPETPNLVSANGQVYDRSSPRGTYLNILV